MTMKKKILTTLSVVLILGMAALGILAYLSDTDSDVNVMTLGNVKIEQIEQEWGNGFLVDFTQGKPLYPCVGSLGWTNTSEADGAYRTFTMNNAVDKYVSVKNTGKSDAYVRTFIALEMGDMEMSKYAEVISASVNSENGTEFPGLDWIWTDDFVTEIDGNTYNIMVAVHKDPVKSGETTIPSLLQVYMKSSATNEDCEAIDGNGNGTFDILVYSEAVQTEGFADAMTALNTAFGDTSEPNRYHPWEGEVVIPVLVNDVDDMRKAMKTPGAKMVLKDDLVIDDDKGTGYALYAKYDCEIDLNGHDIKVNLPGKEFYGAIYALNGAKVDIIGDGNVEINGGVGNWVWSTGANGPTEVNIYGGNWVQESDDFTTENSMYCEGIYANRAGVINIYGGVFDWSGFEKYTVNESRDGVVNIYGGTFVNFDPTVSHDSDGSYVAEGCKVISEIKANGDIWYTVVSE